MTAEYYHCDMGALERHRRIGTMCAVGAERPLASIEAGNMTSRDHLVPGGATRSFESTRDEITHRTDALVGGGGRLVGADKKD